MNQLSIFDDLDDEFFPGLAIAPIRHRAVGSPRRLTLVLSGCLFTALSLGFMALRVAPSPRAAPTPTKQAISVDLGAFAPPQDARQKEGGRTRDPLKGAGHRFGTGTVDPELLKRDPPSLISTKLPVMEVPDILPSTLPDTLIIPSFRKDLPVAPGGNGAPRGTGLELGTGGMASRSTAPERPGTAPSASQILYPIHMVNAWTVAPQGMLDLQEVRVRITIKADGTVATAEAVSGPQNYHANCIRAALQWRFFVPETMKRQAPILHFITFLPQASSKTA